MSESTVSSHYVQPTMRQLAWIYSLERLEGRQFVSPQLGTYQIHHVETAGIFDQTYLDVSFQDGSHHWLRYREHRKDVQVPRA